MTMQSETAVTNRPHEENNFADRMPLVSGGGRVGFDRRDVDVLLLVSRGRGRLRSGTVGAQRPRAYRDAPSVLIG